MICGSAFAQAWTRTRPALAHTHPAKNEKTHQPGAAPAHTPPHAPRREANGLAPAPRAFRLTLISHNNDYALFFSAKIRGSRTHTLKLYAHDGHQRIGCKVYAAHAHTPHKPTKAVGIKRSFEYVLISGSRGADLINPPNR